VNIVISVIECTKYTECSTCRRFFQSGIGQFLWEYRGRPTRLSQFSNLYSHILQLYSQVSN